MESTNHIVKLFGDPTPFYYYIIELCNSLGFTGVMESTVILNVGDTVSVGDEIVTICVKVKEQIPETIPDVFFYEKFDTCEQCIACNGIYYVLSGCTSETFETIESNSSYLPGDFIQVGYECYQVITSIESSEGDPILASSPSFPYCNSCNTNKIIMSGTSCFGGIDVIYVYTDSTTMIGDIVSVGLLGLTFDCFVLEDIITPEEYSGGTYSGVTILNSKSETSCESCSRNFAPILINFSACSDSTKIYQGLFPISSLNNFDIGDLIFSFGGTECYSAIESIYDICPFKNQPKFYPVYYYSSCQDCYTHPLSAGTEYKMCVQDCSGTTFSSVSVPHPTWTNNQGKSIVLLDAVQLGGNGLYS